MKPVGRVEAKRHIETSGERLQYGIALDAGREEYVDLIDQILRDAHTIAVVGLSEDPGRDSHRVARYLQAQDYRIIPVNPNVAEALGERSYPDLKSVPETVDLVNIFRRSELVPPVVDQAIELGVKYIWMQDGVMHREAAGKAQRSGIPVVMNDCMLRQHRRRTHSTGSGA